MKTTFLVKKNPEQPAGENNWIIMDGSQFFCFKQSEEGKRRSNNFIKLCTEYDDECIVMECDLEKLEKWKAELNHKLYLDKVNKEAGYGVVSYHSFDTEDGEMNGEEVLVDESKSIEELIIEKMDLEKAVRLLEQLCEEDKVLIYSFYFTTNPISEAAYAKIHGLSQQLVHHRKVRALQRLKNLYFL